MICHQKLASDDLEKFCWLPVCYFWNIFFFDFMVVLLVMDICSNSFFFAYADQFVFFFQFDVLFIV